MGDDFASQAEKAIPAVVRMFSGCKDEQTSADVSNVASFDLPPQSGPKGAGGACTNALLANVYNATTDISWVALLRGMRDTLKTKAYTQIPQLSGSRSLNLEEKFGLVHGSGNRKALFIGINYIGQKGQLAGCHNDVIGMQKLLDSYEFKRDAAHQMVLMDDDSHEHPTRANIMRGFQFLAEGAAAGDSLFMHYSGHGGSIRDADGDEKDGKDETMCPSDFRSAGMITDDTIFRELVLKLPKGVTLTVLMDCCHSGSILDLPYTFTASGEALTAVESGSAPPQMQPSPGFNFGKILQIGTQVFAAYQRGGASAAVGALAAGAGGAGAGAAARSAMKGDIGGAAMKMATGGGAGGLAKAAKSCSIL